MYVWQLLRDVFTEIGSMYYATETAGSSQVLITDSTLSLTTDGYIGGTVFVIKAGGAAPEGEIVRITDNDATTMTINSLSANIDIGDEIGYISKEFRKESLYHLVNIGLDYIGLIGAVDTSITTADNQTEYTFPLALKSGVVKGVYLQTNDNDANDNRWYPIRDWQVEPDVAGSTATLIIPQLSSGYTIKIEYIGLHPDVEDYDDIIHESIHPELAKAAVILALQNKRSEMAIGSQDSFNLLYNKAKDTLEQMIIKHPVWVPDKKVKRLRISDGRYLDVESEPDKVRL